MGAPGVLSRMFCFSVGARVREEPRRRAVRSRAEERAAPPPPSDSPTAAEALAAYFGRKPLTAPASLPPRDTSADESVPQSSTHNSVVSSLDSGGSGSAAQDPGYEADSDDDFQPPSEDSVTSQGRRFRPALRHYKRDGGQEQQFVGGAAAATGGAEGGGGSLSGVPQAGAAGGAVGGLIEQFEQLSISSSSQCGSPASAGAPTDSKQERQPVPAAGEQAACPWPGTSTCTCTAEVHVHPSDGVPTLASCSIPSQPGAAGPLPSTTATPAGANSAAAGSKSMSRCSSGTSLAASGSISLAHFLGADSAVGSGRSNSFKVRRLGSTQVVVADPDSPAAHSARSTGAEGATGGAADTTTASGPPATPSRPPGLPKSHSSTSTSSGGSSRASRSGTGRAEQLPQQPGAALVVQRRLNEIQSGHYITFEKLRSQCGDFQEPPGDLLSLMARRVFASRSSHLMQRLCSEGVLSDLQAGDSGLPTPSQGSGAVLSPRGRTLTGPQQPAAAQQAAPEQAEAPAGVGDGLPRLPRIRTRVGQLKLEGGDGGSEAGSSGSSGGSASGNVTGGEVKLCEQ